MKTKVIAIMGPSGSGKDTLAKEIIKRNPSLHLMTMYTTRPKRDRNDNAYQFVSKEEFQNMLNLDMIIYYEVYNDWYYGYALEAIDKTQIAVLTPSAVRHFSNNKSIDLTVFYLLVPEEERIDRCLRREGHPDEKEIARRAEADREDFSNPPAAITIPNLTQEDFNNAIQLILSKAIK